MVVNYNIKSFIRIIDANKRKTIIISSVSLSVLSLTIFKLPSHLQVKEDFTCYTTTENDSLQLIDTNFVTPRRSIHFHETSCKGRLDSRQACTVESAAKAHPNKQINVFFTGPVTKENLEISFKPLTYYSNVKVFRINILEYAKETPIYGLLSKGVLNSRYLISHTSDALRYLTLYRYGGIYLDLDMVVARSLDELGHNWAAAETNAVSSGALAFSYHFIGRKIAALCLRYFRENFNGSLWGHNGPDVITKALKTRCNPLKRNETFSCGGFLVYKKELIYPVDWTNVSKYFGTEELDLGELKPYTYHISGSKSSKMQVVNGSVYARLAQKYCPKVYEYYGDNFGL